MSRSSFDVFYQLPASVSCVILGQWLNVSTLVRLHGSSDSGRKAQLAEILRSKGFTFHSAVDVSSIKLITWLLEHEVKTSNLVFKHTCSDPGVLSKFLRFSGFHVRTIAVSHNQPDQIVTTIALYCKSIVTVKGSGAEIKSVFNEVMWCNPNIQKIHFKKIKCNVEGVFEGVNLHSLVVLDVSGAKCKRGFPWSATAFSDTLLQVNLSNCDLIPEDMVAMVANCPQIRALGLSNTKLRDNVIQQIVSLNPRIVHLDVSYNSITDAAILIVATELKALRSMDCQGCVELTSNAMLHLASHCGNTLEDLSVSVVGPNLPETERNLEQSCKNLHVLVTLEIDCDKELLCSGSGTYSIAHGCPVLEVLIVDRDAISASGRMFLADLRPTLDIQDRDSTNGYNVLNMRL